MGMVVTIVAHCYIPRLTTLDEKILKNQSVKYETSVEDVLIADYDNDGVADALISLGSGGIVLACGEEYKCRRSVLDILNDPSIKDDYLIVAPLALICSDTKVLTKERRRDLSEFLRIGRYIDKYVRVWHNEHK